MSKKKYQPGQVDYAAYPDGRDPYADSTTDVMRMAWNADAMERAGQIIEHGRIVEINPAQACKVRNERGVVGVGGGGFGGGRDGVVGGVVRVLKRIDEAGKELK